MLRSLLLRSVFLLPIASCQQAAYSFLATKEARPRLTISIACPSLPDVVEAPVVAQPTLIDPALPARRAHRLLIHSPGRAASFFQFRTHHQLLMTNSVNPEHRLASNPQRTPLISNNARNILVLIAVIAVTALLLASGLFLIIKVGGGLAVTAGIALLLAGLVASFLSFCAIAMYAQGGKPF